MDIREQKSYPEQLEIIEKGKQHFRRIIEVRKKEWAEEYGYWTRMGWL
jgi:hypothetical protein